MARRSSLIVVGVLLQLLDTSRLDAQRAVSGTVRDGGDSLLPGVSVSVAGPSLSEPRSVVTDGEGRYSFQDLPDGTYTLTFALPGFVEATRSDIVLPAADASPLDIIMRVGALEETITLTGLRPAAGRNPQEPPANCTMRVLPADPSIDKELLKEPPSGDYTLQIVPPPCQASHPAQRR
jgi:hypothetical protein